MSFCVSHHTKNFDETLQHQPIKLVFLQKTDLGENTLKLKQTLQPNSATKSGEPDLL